MSDMSDNKKDFIMKYRDLREGNFDALDAATYVPGPIGQGASAISAVRNVKRGEYGKAAVDAIGAFPFGKQATTAGKIAVDAIRRSAKTVGAASDATDIAQAKPADKPNIPSSGRSVDQYEKDTIKPSVKESFRNRCQALREEHAMMKMDPHSFDQSSKGWRSLPGHEQQKVLKSYISKYVGPGGKFSKDTPRGDKKLDSSTLRWHLGQTQAMSGKKGDAVRNMERSKKDSDPQWNRYVKSTTSFLRGDKEGFDKNASGQNYNKKIIGGLKKNWGKDYKNAY